MRLIKGRGTNICPAFQQGFFVRECKMETGYFYYITDEYYNKFANCALMGNKESDISGKHGRPCYYCFEYNGLYWMIPISSRVEKYQKLYDQKMERYKGSYDGIRFGFVNGQKRAFLIQNLCPVTEKYIACQYKIEKDTVPVSVNDKLSKELNTIVRKVLRFYYEKGVKIIMTDLDTILEKLKSELLEV